MDTFQKTASKSFHRFVDSHWLSAGSGSPRAMDNTAAIFLQDVHTAVIETSQLVRPGPYLGAQPLSARPAGRPGFRSHVAMREFPPRLAKRNLVI